MPSAIHESSSYSMNTGIELDFTGFQVVGSITQAISDRYRKINFYQTKTWNYIY